MRPGERIRLGLVTWFGLGLVPVAPGTAGSLGGVLVAVCLHAILDPALLVPSLWGVSALLLVLGCSQTRFVERFFGTEDPQAFVLDEVVGYLVAIALYASFGREPGPMAYALGFLAFRAFDIFKLQPARRLEELPGAYGIMADDLVAGLYAGILLLVGLPLLGDIT